jgi:ketosteroid isomerase-like protein
MTLLPPTHSHKPHGAVPQQLPAGRRGRDTGRAMSQENVEIARAFFEAYNRQDFEAALKDAAPNFVLDFSRSLGPYRGVYRLDQIRSLMGDMTATFESVQFEAHEFIEVGEDVVVSVTTHFRGREGIEVTARVAHLWTIRGCTVVCVALYQELREALEAVGLRE